MKTKSVNSILRHLVVIHGRLLLDPIVMIAAAVKLITHGPPRRPFQHRIFVFLLSFSSGFPYGIRTIRY
jgi:hypothetical protein